MYEAFQKWSVEMLTRHGPGETIVHCGHTFMVAMRPDGGRYLIHPPGFWEELQLAT